MVSVRPNGILAAGRAVRCAALGVALLAFGACSGAKRDDSAATSDTAPAAAATPPPSPYVADIPPWPADTTASGVDRDGRLRAALAARVPSCGGETPVVAPDSVGALFPGMPLANLFGRCPHPLQLWHRDNGQYIPALAVKLGNALLLMDASGTMADAVVIRITAVSGARTTEGIGPGSSLAEAQRAYGAPTWRRDQCAVDALFDSRPGLVIHTTFPDNGSDAYTCEDIRRFGTGSDFSHFPRGATVGWIAAELVDVD